MEGREPTWSTLTTVFLDACRCQFSWTTQIFNGYKNDCFKRLQIRSPAPLLYHSSNCSVGIIALCNMSSAVIMRGIAHFDYNIFTFWHHRRHKESEDPGALWMSQVLVSWTSDPCIYLNSHVHQTPTDWDAVVEESLSRFHLFRCHGRLLLLSLCFLYFLQTRTPSLTHMLLPSKIAAWIFWWLWNASSSPHPPSSMVCRFNIFLPRWVWYGYCVPVLMNISLLSEVVISDRSDSMIFLLGQTSRLFLLIHWDRIEISTRFVERNIWPWDLYPPSFALCFNTPRLLGLQ